MFVECLVMDGRQAQAIAWVEPVRLVLPPRHDMTGDEKRVAYAREAATAAIAGQHGASEELLLDTLLHDGLAGFAAVVIKDEVIFTFDLEFGCFAVLGEVGCEVVRTRWSAVL